MSVRTVEYLSKLFKDGRATPNEREQLLAAFSAQINGPKFDPTAISSTGKQVLARVRARAKRRQGIVAATE